MKKIESVRNELLFDYLNKLKLEKVVDANFYKGLATTHLKNNKFHEAALIIHKFKFFEEFDCRTILEKLVDSNRVPVAKLLCEGDDNLKIYLINRLSTNEHAKLGA